MLSGIDTFAVRRIRGNPSATNASFSDGGSFFETLPVVRCFDPAGATVRTQAVAPAFAFNRPECKFDAPNVMIGSRDWLGVSCSTSAKQPDITHRPRPVVPCYGPIDHLFYQERTDAHTVQSAPGLTDRKLTLPLQPGRHAFSQSNHQHSAVAVVVHVRQSCPPLGNPSAGVQSSRTMSTRARSQVMDRCNIITVTCDPPCPKSRPAPERSTIISTNQVARTARPTRIPVRS